jgi:hypothetical protein
MHGPGKYDAQCTLARQSTSAAGAILLILGGNQGNGFSVQLPPTDMHLVPAMLRHMADVI